jgi:DNA gyrase subunit A
MLEIKEKVIPVLIEEEMRNSYIDYSMSVIVARALPDVRDGLKPVHRRVLYGMLDLGLRPSSAYKKSARIVGEVLGKYHPHGDTAVYDAMVRMVQDFSLRYPLVDGQGNFGSVDGDSPAAMRYTEAKLAHIAEEVLRDIEKDTVNFVSNFDDSLKEPSVLPSLLPTLLVNGGSGIAVGMATNIPPHNLNEVVDALAALIDKPDLKPEAFLNYIKGPDFPTGGVIFGALGIDEYFKTGRGKLTVRARAHVEDMGGGRERIVVTEIPYQVNKVALIERVSALVREKKLEGLAEIRDESDREGMRIVFELRRDADSSAILKEMYKHTQMQTTFGVILLALVNGQPKVLNIKQMLSEFLSFRHEIVLRRTKFELEQAEKRAHILEGLKIALDNIDEIISLIRKSRDADTARTNLMKRFKLSEIQAQAILDMRLQRLTGLERKKIEEEYLELIKLIEKLKSLLASKSLRMQLVKEELLEIKKKYGDARRTQIIAETSKKSFDALMAEDEMVIAISHKGSIKRYSLEEYQMLDEKLKIDDGKDFVEIAFNSANSHSILVLGRSGRCYSMRANFIPSASNSDNGTAISKLLHISREEKFACFIEISKFNESQYIFIATTNGQVKKIALSEFSKLKDAGVAAINLKEKDELTAACLTNGKNEILIATANGKAIRFSEEDVRDMGLAAGGIKGINLEEGDVVIGMIAIQKPEATLLSITDLGFGKRSSFGEYSTIGRGGKGIVNYKVAPKVGRIAAILETQESDQLLLITKKGKTKRIKSKELKIMGRASQGAKVTTIAQGDAVEKIVIFPKVVIGKTK